MKSYVVCSMARLIAINPSTRRKWVVSFTPRSLYPDENGEGNIPWIKDRVAPRSGLDVHLISPSGIEIQVCAA